MTHRFEIYKDKAGEYRVRFKYNSEIMWSSEGYRSKSSAINLINSIKKSSPSAPVNDLVSEFEDLRRKLANAPIPAADRIVRIDHNSKESKEFSAALQKLTESIRTSNDFGNFTEEEVEAVKFEVSMIDPGERQQWVRPSYIWQVAKSTLLWIADKAAGAVIGALALAALAALAMLLGIPI